MARPCPLASGSKDGGPRVRGRAWSASCLETHRSAIVLAGPHASASRCDAPRHEADRSRVCRPRCIQLTGAYLHAHLPAPMLVHRPNGGLGDQGIGGARLRLRGELDQVLAVADMPHAVLHELDRLVVLEAE